MSFVLDEGQEGLRRAVRAFLDEVSPSDEVRRVMETDPGYDPDVWRRMATELGLPGRAVPREHGGAGGGPVELAVVFEEMGRALACAPYLSTAGLAAAAVTASGDEAAAKELLPGIAAGDTVATVAVAEDSGRWHEDGVSASATRTADGYRLDGRKSFVTDGHTADVVLVAARTQAGVGLFVVEGDAPGLRRELLATMDQTRRQARLELSSTPGRPLEDDGRRGGALARALDLGAVALAAEQVGGAERCLEMSVAHARAREQFGRAIGSFQAVKHKLADMLVLVEQGRSAAYHAAWAAAEGSDDAPLAAAVAKAYCSEAYVQVATETVHVYGASGFTWAHDAQLHFKRAMSSRALLGDPAHHRETVARSIGL